MGTSKLIMGLTLVLVVSLALVLGLVLVLLAELYCSLLIRRRLLRTNSPTAALTASTVDNNSSPQGQSAAAAPSLSSFYSQGVLTAPRSFLFPAVSDNDIEKQDPKLPENQESGRTQHHDGSPQVGGKVQIQKGCASNSGHGAVEEHLVYISNPIYDNENGRPSRADNTPFETPDTSPSRLETEDWSGEDDEEKEEIISSSPNCSSSKLLITPPLTPMKKLPAEACSVSLKDARSLGTSGSDSNSNNGVSSSSSGTPCTSPSW